MKTTIFLFLSILLQQGFCFNVNPNQEILQVYRYDVHDLWQKTRLTRTIVNATSAVTQPKLVPGQPAFAVTINCNATASVCTKASNSFDVAISYILQGIRVKQQVKVRATFRPFCNGQLTGCSSANTLGQASASSYFLARKDATKQYSYYPQALIKQFTTDYAVQYSQYDIDAEFNTDFTFWYESDGVPATFNSIPLSYVVAHELTHGLGFDSLLYPSSLVYGNMLNLNGGIDAVLPQLVLGVDNLNRYVTYLPSTWDGVHIYDEFLYDSITNSTFRQLINRIFAYRVPQYTLLQTFYNGLKTSGDPWNAAVALTNALTTGSNTAQFLTGSLDCGNPFISTSSGFNPGSSTAHLDYTNFHTSSDFLMCPALGSNMGRSLADTIALYNQTERVFGVYGARELQILGAIGWNTVISDSTTSSLFIQTSYGISVAAISSDVFTVPSVVSQTTCTNVSFSLLDSIPYDETSSMQSTATLYEQKKSWSTFNSPSFFLLILLSLNF